MPKRKRRYKRNPSEEEELFAEWLREAIQEYSEGEIRAETYYEAGLMTNNAGLVAQDEKGKEFQITIKRSR